MSQHLTLENTRIILVRHGQSTFNAQGRYQGRDDQAVLTKKGYDCAYQTGVALQGIHLDAIYTSPLQRAVATTNEIVKAINTQFLPPIQTDNNLLEIDLPAWQGQTFVEVRQNFASDYQCWQQRPHEFQMNSVAAFSRDRHVAVASTPCFPVLNLYDQAQKFWQSILPQHLGKTILVVSHGGTNRALISTALNLAPDRYHAIQQSNCGISVLHFPAHQQSAQLTALNVTNHLGEVLPKLKAGKHGLRLLLLPIDAIEPLQVQHLAAFLQSVDIDFSLTSETDNAAEITNSILQSCPTTVQLHVSRHDFPLAWQQAIATRPHAASHSLVTGLVIASSNIIKCILGQNLGLNSKDFWRLQLKSGDLSVVHYPLLDLPVSQTINLSYTAKQISSSQEQFS